MSKINKCKMFVLFLLYLNIEWMMSVYCWWVYACTMCACVIAFIRTMYFIFDLLRKLKLGNYQF